MRHLIAALMLCIATSAVATSITPPEIDLDDPTQADRPKKNGTFCSRNATRECYNEFCSYNCYRKTCDTYLNGVLTLHEVKWDTKPDSCVSAWSPQ